MSRSVLITGGNRGIGLAIARAFAAQGDHVAVTRHTTAAPDGLLGVKCDVADRDSIGAAFTEIEKQHGPVQVLVTCAGITRDKPFQMMAPADITDVIDTNLTGALYAAHRAVPQMRKAGFGRIIFVSSVVGLLGAAGQVNYAAAKAGLIGAARSLAREYGRKGITTNVLAPGLTNTDMIKTIPEKAFTAMVDTIPVGRIGEPDEIARLAVFLGDDKSGYINGGFYAIDGGAATGH